MGGIPGKSKAHAPFFIIWLMDKSILDVGGALICSEMIKNFFLDTKF